MVQDLIALDYCTKELEAFRNLSIKYRNLLNTQDTVIEKLKASQTNLKTNLNLCTGLAEEQDNKIIKLEKEVRVKTRAKRIWAVLATAAAAAATVIYVQSND